MTNIFKNAKFGDKFRTKEGWYAVYDGIEHHNEPDRTGLYHVLRYRGKNNKYCITILYCNDDGTQGKGRHHNYDIISEWKEEIDEKELDLLSHEELHKTKYHPNLYLGATIPDYDIKRKIFKAGYRKALELYKN